MGQAGNDLHMSSVMIAILHFSTESVTATWLLPEMVERVASMLNYFLNVLTGEVQAILNSCLSLMIHCSSWVLQPDIANAHSTADDLADASLGFCLQLAVFPMALAIGNAVGMGGLAIFRSPVTPCFSSGQQAS